MSADPNPLREAAEAYARQGWYVFPLKPRDKTPLTTHGLKDASTNLDTVRRWWANSPNANIGLNCGKSGLVVIDLDKRGDYDGLAEWDQLVDRHRFDTRTAVSQTGGGGKHLLFGVNGHGPIKNSAGKLAPGIDVRGEGGYIVLPPSIHPNGKPYTWGEAGLGISPLPDPVAHILTTEPDPWQIYTLRDAFAPRPPLTWLVENIVPSNSLSVWYGAPGSLKSMLLADLCVSVAAGHNWLAQQGALDRTGYATTPAPILWLDFDNGQRRTHERFAALARARSLPDAAPIYYTSMPTPVLAAGDTASIQALYARLVARNVGLLVIDNLGKVTGGMDENSADMQAPMDGLRWLAEQGLAVIVIHHQRKSNGTSGGTRAGEALRGHGSIEAALDLALQITREDNDIAATSTKTRGKDVTPFKATFSYENDAAHELITARFWPADIQAAESEASRTLRDKIIANLNAHGAMSANDMHKRMGGNRNHLFDVLRQMNVEKEITKRDAGGGRFVICLP